MGRMHRVIFVDFRESNGKLMSIFKEFEGKYEAKQYRDFVNSQEFFKSKKIRAYYDGNYDDSFVGERNDTCI